MPTFSYKAKRGPGDSVEGRIDAETKSAALHELDSMGYTPIWVREFVVKRGTGRIRGGGRIRHRDIGIFTRQLASLTRSGVPILRGLRTLEAQTTNHRLQRVIGDLHATVRDGSLVSAAMARHPAVFPELYINMVRSGESGGILDVVLFRLADAQDREEEIRRKIQAAVAYPLLVLVVGVLTVVFLLTVFMPRVASLYRGYTDLPWPTRLLIGASDFFAESWYWFALVLLLVMAVVKRIAVLEKGRLFFDGLRLRIPVLGRSILQSEIARFARTLSLLLAAGIGIDRALGLSGDTLRNTVLRDEVQEICRRTVNRGDTLSSGLEDSRHFPPLVSNMAAVGEEGGNLDKSLSEIALFYENEVDLQSRLATSLLEPVLILAVGLIVGFIVAAMLLPVFELGTGM
jgi:type II secretory pathway component PulF